MASGVVQPVQDSVFGKEAVAGFPGGVGSFVNNSD